MKNAATTTYYLFSKYQTMNTCSLHVIKLISFYFPFFSHLWFFDISHIPVPLIFLHFHFSIHFHNGFYNNNNNSENRFGLNTNFICVSWITTIIEFMPCINNIHGVGCSQRFQWLKCKWPIFLSKELVWKLITNQVCSFFVFWYKSPIFHFRRKKRRMW